VLESAVREIKSVPQDTVNVIGDAVKLVGDEAAVASRGIASVFKDKDDPVAQAEKAAALETAGAWNSANDIVFRSYKVSEPVGNELLAGKNVQPNETVDVSGYFAGVEFPEGTSAMYRPEFKKLFVRQTPGNFLLIEDVLGDRHSRKRELMGKQVEIQTKFVEVSQNTLNELGFSWNFDRKNGGDANLFENLTLPQGTDIMAAGLRTASGALGADANPGSLLVQKTAGSLQWKMIISALEQANDSDVLSAPSITTLNGKTANIWVGEQRMVPKSFEAKTQNTSVFVENKDWESQLMGVQLEVKPELRKGGLIDLELKPKVIDLLGYDTYQITPTGPYGPDGKSASMMVWARSSAMAMTLPTAPALSILPSTATPAVGTNTLGEIVRFPVQSILAPVTHIPGMIDTYWNRLYSTFMNAPTPTVIPPEVGDADGDGVALTKADWAYYNASRVNSDTRRKMEHDEYGIPVPALEGKLPYFRLREMQTKVTVADGSTVGMGGLIYDKLETYKDKVPVLGSIPLIGRLFRSEGERSVKRNLMIFVTATQVDVNGRRAADLVMQK
jgi:type II secretory pathway component GspD/PulD (secretin)